MVAKIATYISEDVTSPSIFRWMHSQPFRLLALWRWRQYVAIYVFASGRRLVPEDLNPRQQSSENLNLTMYRARRVWEINNYSKNRWRDKSLEKHRRRWEYNIKNDVEDTRWFKYDRDKLWLVYTRSVPVIFEPPCTLCDDVRRNRLASFCEHEFRIFWVITRREVVWNRRFRTICRSHLRKSSCLRWWSRNVGFKPPHFA